MIKLSSKILENCKKDADSSLWLDYLIEPSVLEIFFNYCKKFLEKGTCSTLMGRMNDDIVASADSIWLDVEPGSPDFDCRKGCSWCCHQSVAVTWPELLNIVSYLQKNLKQHQLKALKNLSKEKGDEILKKMNINSNGAAHRVPCLFLEDDICSIHAVRPLQCRGAFSEKEDYCKSLLEHPEVTQKAVEAGSLNGEFLIVPKLIYNSAQVAMTYAMKDTGMKGYTFELTIALSILMTKLSKGKRINLVEDDLKPAVMPQNYRV